MEQNDNFWLLLCFAVFLTLVFAAVTRENMKSSPVPTLATSTAPALSLRCRDGYFYIENRFSNRKVPLIDFDSHGDKRHVPCSPAYEAIRSRRMMGYQ